MENPSWQEPTGILTIKKNNRELYHTTQDPAGARFVNTNKRCKDCRHKNGCYIGRHAIVVACPGEGSDSESL